MNEERGRASTARERIAFAAIAAAGFLLAVAAGFAWNLW